MPCSSTFHSSFSLAPNPQRASSRPCFSCHSSFYRASPRSSTSVRRFLVRSRSSRCFCFHARRRRPLTAWAYSAFWAVTGVIMSLSPTATWYGRPLRLPNSVIADWLPIYQFLRIPNRLGAVGLIGLALLAGVAFAECARRLADRERFRLLALVGPVALATLVVVGAYAEYSGAEPGFDRDALPRSYPLALAISADSPVVRALQEPGGPLLELPVGLSPPLGCLPGPHAKAEYRSIFHWRPLLNGYSGYWPAGVLGRLVLATPLPR